MPQSMLGASTKLPACIAACINYAAECSYYFQKKSFVLLFNVSESEPKVALN